MLSITESWINSVDGPTEKYLNPWNFNLEAIINLHNNFFAECSMKKQTPTLGNYFVVLNPNSNPQWPWQHLISRDRVVKLEKGNVYYEGTVKILQNLTGWRGHQVLYFGDHPYSDLAGETRELIFKLFLINCTFKFTRCDARAWLEDGRHHQRALCKLNTRFQPL